MPGTPSNSDIRAAHSRAVGGARPRCSRGKSCSAACISRSDFCLVEIPVSPAQALSKVRSEVEGAKVKQMPLFDVGSVLGTKGVQAGVDKFKASLQENILGAIKEGSQEKYDKERERAISFNRRLVEDNLISKAGLVRVPISWEKLQQVRGNYEKAYDLTVQRAKRAAMNGDRKAYLKEERRLMAMEQKFKDKTGSTKRYLPDLELGNPEKYVKGSIWYDWYESPSKQKSLVRSLNRNPALSLYSIDLANQGTRLDVDRFVRGDNRTHRVSVSLAERGTSISFTINGRYDRPQEVTRRDGIKLANTVREAFREIAKSLAIGSVITCYPYEDDGLGDKRKALYLRAGFREGPGGILFAKVADKSGRVVPATEEDFKKFIAKGQFAFSEVAPPAEHSSVATRGEVWETEVSDKGFAWEVY